MKFNRLIKNRVTVKNHEGANAYKLSPEMELYTAVVTSSLSNTFYEKEDKRLNRIIELIKNTDPVFVARLAIYAREKMHLRTMPIVLVTELSKVHNGDSLVKRTTERIIQRADEITELLAYYQLSNERKYNKKLNKLSKQLQKGIAASFNKFDEYQFAKYDRKSAVSLKDALFLTHPKAVSTEQQALFNKIVNGNLETPYTWEVELSRIGQDTYISNTARKVAVREKWQELVASKRLGYMALLRNLRNILEAEVKRSTIELVYRQLSDEEAVKRSKQLPFRFLAAYNELLPLKVPYVNYIIDALENAIKASAVNIKGFDLSTRALIAADVSGSMFSYISGKSKIRCYDIGLVLSMILASRSDNVVTGIFGNKWKQVNMSRSAILPNIAELNRMEGSVGYATNGYTVIDALISNRRVMDKVFFFTDLQLWDSRYGGNSLQRSWDNYKQRIAPNAKLYLFDLMGYGQVPLRSERDDVHLIAGWSDKIFDILEAMEQGASALAEIDRIEI